MKLFKPLAVVSLPAVIALVIHACKPLTVDDVLLRPTVFSAVGSQTLTATAGTTISNPATVRLLDQDNQPMPGVPVTFSSSVGGSVPAPTVSTNSQGQAALTSWIVPTTVGSSHTLTARIPQSTLQVVFTATVNPAAAAAIAVVTETPSSNNQTVAVGQSVAVAPGVIVRDAFSNAVTAGVSVTFTVGANSGTIQTTSTGSQVTSGTVLTGGTGVARLVNWRPGNRGPNTLTAALTTLPSISVTFTATGTAGPPASIVIENANQNNQSTIANTNLPLAPCVIVRDATGLTVDAGVNISFATVLGGGGVSTTAGGSPSATVTVPTNASGLACLGFWRPGTVGSSANTMRASVASATSINVLFTASGTTGPPTTMVDSNLPWPYTVTAANNGGLPKITLTDVGGNPITNHTITWSAGGSSSVSGTLTSLTNSTGVAQFGGAQGGVWTATGAAGASMSLTASAQGTGLTVNFTSLIVGAPNGPTSTATNGSATTTVNTVVSTNPVLTVRDANNNPVPGVAITWSYTANPGVANGGFTGPQLSTDSVGRATPGAWRVSQSAGTNTIRAELTATPSIFFVFSTTGTAGPTTAIAVNAGNNQTAAISTAVGIAPSVVVRDQFSNVVNGQSVTFTAATGSGTVSGSLTTSNANGIATTNSWTLGATAGTHTLTATVTGSSPAISTTFTATATSGNPCTTPTAHTVGTSVGGTLASTDCNHVSSGTFYMDKYQIVVPAATTRLMSASLTTSSIGPSIRSFLYPPTTNNWITEQAAPGTSTAYYVLGPGTYEIGATSFTPTTTGSYTFSTTLNPAMPSPCRNFLSTKGITVTHSFSTTDCIHQLNFFPGTDRSSRIYLIYLPANQTMTVRLNSNAGPDVYVEAYDITATRSFIAANDDGGGFPHSLLTLSSSASNRFIEIRASHLGSPNTGSFTLIIDP